MLFDDFLSSLPPLQWYPGHIAKLKRALNELMAQVDACIEVRDARLVATTAYTPLQDSPKPRLVLLTKADLAEPTQTKLWCASFTPKATAVQPGSNAQQILRALDPYVNTLHAKMQARGRKPRALRVMVVGMPNVGKSSLINRLVSKKATKTGHKAGVTRAPQWIRVHDRFDLMDTPGIIPPVLDSVLGSWKLALVHGVGDATFDDETAAQVLIALLENAMPTWRRSYDLEPTRPFLHPGEGLEAMAKARSWLMKGGSGDTIRAAQTLLSDFRHGKLGRLTLDRVVPDEAEHADQN